MAGKKGKNKRAKGSEDPRPEQPPSTADVATRQLGPVSAAAPPEESRPGPPDPPVAGIGASAGGLDALKKLFTAMPADTGIGFVLLPHLDPRHESLMVELLARHTSMPVAEAVDGMKVVADQVYVIPPNKYMTIAQGTLRLSGPVERSGPQTSIDLFLRSLAEDRKEQAICIILSGTGAHGALGLKAVKESGGMAMVQDPATADYAAMPESAVATDLADFVLPVEQMPQALVSYLRHAYVNGGKAGADRKDAVDDLNQVLALVRARTRLDFRQYRKKMLARRIERRMSLCQIHRTSDYLRHLRHHPDELRHLSRDLLISVTSFFRDPEAWQTLAAQVIGPLVRDREPDPPIRVWCAGCATGEEPYTLGLLLLEHLAAAQKTCPLQIFATDVDDVSLDVARRGIYPESISADVSPERLSRYFTRVSESSFQVGKQLRETVIFARQNLISDAPFSKLDLVVCRNLLIYLEQEVQKKVIALLHFALNENGALFLGTSETIGRNVDLFEPISAKSRIFRRIGPVRSNNVQFPVSHVETREAKPTEPPGKPVAPPRLPELAQNFLLRRFALACVVINRNYEVLHFAGPTEDYLIQPGGPPTHDLLALARPGLESKLRVVVQRAIRENAPQGIKNVTIPHGAVSRRIDIEVEPLTLSKQTEGLLLIVFQEQGRVAGETIAEAKVRTQNADSDLMRQLEQELETTREDLQGTIEELESSNEELKASNEEIMSMNEELQSANEELETSKEELQSLNEELSTVNNQLHDKVGDLESANNDMANFLNCTDVATVFLDSRFCIRRFTPAATRLFSLIPTDVGRPIGDIARRFGDDDLLKDAGRFLHDLKPSEKEVPLDDGTWCLRRIVPYRTLDNRIDGIVFTFVDITERKLAADAVVRRLAAVVEAAADAIYSYAPDGVILTWNQGAARLYGYTDREAIGSSIRPMIPEDRLPEWSDVMNRLAGGEHVEQFETERICKEGRRIPVSVTYSPLCDADGHVVAISVIARNITERRLAEVALRDSEERLRAILNSAADAFITIDRSGLIRSVNLASERIFGFAAAEMIGQNVKMLMPAPYRDEHDAYLARYLQTGRKRLIGIGREVQGRRKDGTVFPMDLAVSEVEPGMLFTGIVRDISRRKEMEREIVEIASLEQRRIGQDLHDTVSQELTALAMLAADLSEALRTNPDEAALLARRIAEGMRRSQQKLRTLMRGLIPVAVDGEGLMAALSELADRTRNDNKIPCTFHCPDPVALNDNLAATHLYLIAQEAVHNAIKHAQPRTIRIGLEANEVLKLSIEDDGDGIAVASQAAAVAGGLGLRIMRNRTAIIGGMLTIEPIQPTGTRVLCTVSWKNHGHEENPPANPDPDRR